MTEFIVWLRDTHIEESKRKPLPDEATTGNNLRFKRWIVANISIHINPDKFLKETKSKQILMTMLTEYINKYINILKGI